MEDTVSGGGDKRLSVAAARQCSKVALNSSNGLEVFSDEEDEEEEDGVDLSATQVIEVDDGVENPVVDAVGAGDKEVDGSVAGRCDDV